MEDLEEAEVVGSSDLLAALDFLASLVAFLADAGAGGSETSLSNGSYSNRCASLPSKAFPYCGPQRYTPPPGLGLEK